MKGFGMIFGKMWAALSAQINKLANVFWEADPIAQMTYEYDLAVEQLKEGRKGLEALSPPLSQSTRRASQCHHPKK